MNNSTLRNLGLVLFALIAVMLAFEFGDRDQTGSSGDPLFADLKERINDVTGITLEAAGEAPTTVGRESGTWTVSSRADYPASVGKVREVLLAIADARILERKTANPDRYAQLGVRDPDVEGSSGVRLTVAGDGFEYGVIVGNANQGSNRYVRLAGDAQSLLIDKNPELPDSPSGWLRTDLVDIAGSEVELVTVRHADGEEIAIYKTDREQTDFQVQDIPDGRELSYPTVANSIGSALSDLSLDDVRRAVPGDASTTTAYETFDGLRLTVEAFDADDEVWVAIAATALSADAAAADAGDAAGAAAGDEPDVATADPVATAAAINDRLAGWHFRIPSFKANQLTRRWDDILEEVAEDEDADQTE